MPVGSIALQTASNTGQVISPDEGQKTFRVWFTFKLTGNYPTGGDPIDLTQLFALLAGGPGASLPTGSLPIKLEFTSANPAAQANLFVYNYLPGSSLSNGAVQVFTGAAAQAGLTQLSAGAYPAGVLADVIEGEAIFPKL